MADSITKPNERFKLYPHYNKKRHAKLACRFLYELVIELSFN
ncbi:hypothetical protein [Halobacillus salinarum]|nr:hypothetical protein [Halobacillus salinarum]